MDSSFEKEPVAIVGSACRFAGDATSPSRLWDLLKNPIDLRQEIPTSRYDPDGFYHPDGSFHGHSNVRHAHFLDQDPAAFDAAFFGIKPVEAKAMDPQQRLLLEVVYEGLESAGIPISKMKGSDTGVYVGVMFNDYAAMMLRDVQDLPTYYATGTGQSILSNRISHFFDLHGPSVTIDTACSSSLVAVHLAVQALRSGESRVALACGANLILGPEGFIIESKLNMLSPDGRSRMWSQGANGYARGEGVGVLVLKTLRAALEDGDEIECIIRETGLGQDGATPGITMPSAAAQETLIRNTYKRAGLDLLNPGDRPQYFEAHGTGTPAGDPAEAEAIYRAFFPSTDGGQLPNPLSLGRGHPLYVGSIKTVLGHTEGAAGVAALIKTSLVLQQGLIPPNLLFDELSDRVAPFYKNVEILRDPRPWPATYGGPRRASVNSFGFGGTNAHAILESHDSKADHLPSSVATTFTPFVLSATSELALRETMSNYATWLDAIQGNLDFNPQDLAWTLRKRRSVFQYRTSFTASSIAELRDKILAKLKDKEIPGIGTRAVSSSISSEEPCGRILGIFTGQGAQYPRMGADLIEKSSTARGIIKRLESYLAQLPEDRPSWSLEAELLADPSVSRLQGAALAQPLCTALQILLVDLLKLAGLQFSAVVGHSSGEIGAAYAAGYLSARDAMLIAYYRGLHASRTADLSGAMLAVGGSMDDMADLCADEAFVGRVTVAAHNSLSSVTISGDEDAIEELELVLEDEGKFYRRLKVDKAYHSHHMMPCFDPYVDSMRRVGIKPLERSGPDQQCPWFSSVYDGRVVDGNLGWGLNGTYWAENMTKPVLFSEALGNALHASSYDLVLEVGPHPALKAPSAQTMKDSLGVDLPYHGLLARGMSAVDALSSALGFMWEHLDRPGVDLDKFERAMTGAEGHRYRLVKGLPAYPWSRERRYWHEARSSRKMRSRHDTVHPLLGDITTDSAPHHASWRNLLRVTEMEWLAGHAVQGQIVFPAAGYLASAIEAAWLVATKSGKEVRLIEISDFAIHQAVAFEHDDASIEVLIELSEVIRRSPGLILAKFTYSAATDPSSVDLSLAASGDVTIHLGEPSPSLLPTRPPVLPHMIDVERERFYAALADLGYNFEGRFRALSSLRRKRGKSTCVVNMQPSSLLIHPAELDAMMQSAILAYSYPYDGELRTLHLPTTITRIRVNPAALRGGATERVGPGEQALVDASIDLRRGQGIDGSIVANINLYAPPSAACRTEAVHAVQAQGVAYVPLRGSTEEEDRRMYSKVDWIHDRPDGIEASRGLWEGEHQRKTAHLLERIATFYLRKFDREVPLDHPARTTFPTKWYLNHARHVAGVVESGKHKWWRDEWHNDTEESVLEASKHHMHLPDVEIMHLVGRQMPRVFAGETTMLEEFRAGGNDVLDRYYAEGLGLRELARWVARAVKQLTDRYPHMNIVEVGMFRHLWRPLDYPG
jgi:acyl transferase domain-containing protein